MIAVGGENLIDLISASSKDGLPIFFRFSLRVSFSDHKRVWV